MSYYTDKEIFYIDSHRKDFGHDTDFTYTLELDQSKNYTDIVLLSASIPKSSYTINAKNNTLIVIEEGISRILTLRVGNFNRSSLRNILSQELNDSTYDYTISYDNPSRSGDDGKYTFVCLTPGINPTFVFTGLWEELGFVRDESYTFTDSILKSVHVSNFRSNAAYYISSSAVSNRRNDILAQIVSTGTDDYNYITYTNYTPHELSKTFSGVKSNSYTFTVLDEDFLEISSLNGLNIVLCVMVFIRKPDVDPLIKAYIKAKMLKDFE
jgi:hypothetical protein